MSQLLPDPQAGHELSVEEVRDLADAIAAGEIVLLDCREDDEWRINRLPDARLASLSDFAAAAPPLLDDPETPCITYCHHGMRSLRAAAWLRSRGHSKAWSMAGGIDAWSDRIDPSVPKY